MLATLEAQTATEVLKILLVEDGETAAATIEYHLEEGFGEEVSVRRERCLADAVSALEEETPNLIILDLGLPDSDGTETFRRVYEEVEGTPIVVLTANGCDHIGTELMKLGAQDFICKTQLEQTSLSRAVAFAVERSKRIRIERDVSAARRVQGTFFPKCSPRVPGLELAGRSIPAEHTSGDCYDFIPMAGGTLGVLIGDASGHGLGAALMMSQGRAFIRTLCDMWSYVEFMAEPQYNVGAVLTHANRLLCQTNTERFITSLLLHIDPQTLRMTYASGAHQGFLFRGDDYNDIETLDSTSAMLGQFEGIDVPNGATLQLRPGDLLFLPTDGIEESHNADGEQLGQERMLREVLAHQDRHPEKILDALVELVRTFQGTETQKDDITAVIIKVR